MPLETKTFVLKPNVMLIISLCSREGKTEIAFIPKQTEILLPRVSRTLHFATNRVKGIHIPH